MEEQGSMKDVVAALPQYKGLIFDLDGTLVDLGVDWRGLKEKLAKYCLLKKNISIKFAPLDQKILLAKKLFGERFYSELLAMVADFEMKEENYKINEELLNYINLLPSQKIAIYSMNTEKCINNIVKKYLKREPNIIVSKDSCQEPKPTGKDILYILRQWKLRNEEVAFIGNGENDFLSGQKAGINTLIINNYLLS